MKIEYAPQQGGFLYAGWCRPTAAHAEPQAGKAVAPQRDGNFRNFAGQHMAFFVIFAQKPNKSGQSPEYGFFCGLFYGRINEQSKSKEAGL